MRPSYRIVSYRIEKKTLISYRYRIESKKSLSLLSGQEIGSDENAKKKKKKSKKNKTPDDEEQVVPEVEDQVLLKNYREAPGVLKGSNILAIPGYGASK